MIGQSEGRLLGRQGLSILFLTDNAMSCARCQMTFPFMERDQVNEAYEDWISEAFFRYINDVPCHQGPPNLAYLEAHFEI